VKGTQWGQADWITYDEESGFALAGGYVLKGHEAEAEAIATLDNIGVSHGFYPESVKRDVNDRTILTSYQSKEISDLPRKNAANKLTGFIVLEKEPREEKMIPEKKKDYLKKVGLTDEAIKGIEDGLSAAAKKANEAGIESKEKETVEVRADEVKTTEVVTETEKPVEKSVESPVEEVSDNDILIAALAEFNKSMKAFTEGINVQIAEIKKEVSDAKETAVLATPRASLDELVINSIIGKKETAVDGRTVTKPKETKATVPDFTGVGFVDEMIAKQRGIL
jgi:hypothetical protein